MSSARLPRKQRKEVLSQSSEHARSVRRDTRPQQIKGRRAFDAEEELRPQSPLDALFEFLASPLPLDVRYGIRTSFHNFGESLRGLWRSLQQQVAGEPTAVATKRRR